MEVNGNIVSQLGEACARYADKTAYSLPGRDVSYHELDELSNYLSAYLTKQNNLQAGDRVAIQLPNILQFPIAVIAVLKAGMVVVNTNPLYTGDELKHQLSDSGAKALIVFSGCAKEFLSIKEHTNIEHVIVTNIADLHTPLKRTYIHLMARMSGGYPSCMEFPALKTFRQAIAQGRQLFGHCDFKQAYDQDSNELAILQYTGGTTGISKGSMLTHRNLISNFRQLESRLDSYCPDPGAVVVAPLPLYHIYAFTMNILFSLMRGCHNVLVINPRQLSLLVRTIKPYKINVFCGINPLYKNLCEHHEFAKLDFSELKICTSGGMPLIKDIADRWHEVTGCKILEGYGMTETSPLIACNDYEDYQTDCIGKALPFTELKIIDSQGNSLEPGEEGELCVKGPQVMKGYWQQAEETALVLDEDGWLQTGDIATIDADGNLNIIERLKDMIIVSGFNVYPAEIENVVADYPGVKDVVVIGVKNSDAEEQVKLIVVPESHSLKKDALRNYCKSKLTAYKVPKIIEFRESLPKSPVGKVLKREL